jgi:hypothetical protein
MMMPKGQHPETDISQYKARGNQNAPQYPTGKRGEKKIEKK